MQQPRIVYETLIGATAVLVGDTVVIDRGHADTDCFGGCVGALLAAARRSELDRVTRPSPAETQA
jgi:hypothetical protein